MSFTMPDVRNLSEADAKAALIAAGCFSGMEIRLFPCVIVGDYDDHDDIGSDDHYPDTVGDDGTVSRQGRLPGTFVSDDIVSLSFNIWGIEGGDLPDDELDVALSDWTTSPETTAWDAPAPEFDESQPWFRVEVTSQHAPDGEGGFVDAEVLYEITEFADLDVDIRINDQRTAQLSISAADPLLATEDLVDFEQYVRVYWRDQLVFWGPLRTEDDAEGRSGAGRVLISGVDVLKLQHHNLRRGDDAALNSTESPDTGSIMADSTGIEAVLEAAQNTAAQNTRGMPGPGIVPGTTSTARAVPLVVERGDNVWETIRRISDSASGPDFEVAPVEDVPGVYAELNCYDTQGANIGRETDPDHGLLFTFGAPPEIGADNLRDWKARRLLPTTHAHVLDDTRKHRETGASEASSAAIGAYVGWIQTGLKLDGGDTTILEEIAAAYINAYGIPPVALDLELRAETAQVWHYGEDYKIGDVVSVYVVKNNRGFINTHMRITGVRLTRPGKRGPIQTMLTVVPQPAPTVTAEEA